MDTCGVYTELIEHAFYSLAHRAGTAHIVFDILGTVVIFQIIVVNHLMDETRSIFDARGIGSRIGTVERKMAP